MTFCIRIDLGSGISGCSIAHFLSRAGKRVAIVERTRLGNGASGVAGAFVNPVVGSPTAWNIFINRSFLFTLNFYQSLASNLITRQGVIKMKPSRISWDDFWQYEKYITLPYKKQSNGFFFPDGSMVDPYRLCTKLVENVDCVWNEIELDVVYKTDSIDFSHHLTNSNQKEQSGPVNNSIHKRLVIFDQTKEKWICDDVFETTNLVLCTGHEIQYPHFPDVSYLHLKELWGEIAVVRTSTHVPYTFSADVLVSPPITHTSTDNNSSLYTIKIGSTHVRNKVDISDPEHRKKRIEDMIQEAINLAMLKDVQIVSIDGALRGTTSDFFPIVGPMIDTTQLKKRYPRIRDCLALPLNKIPLIPNLWICTGFGGRGFVTGPYSAWLLSEAILKGQLSLLPYNILPFRLLYRWLRRQQ